MSIQSWLEVSLAKNRMTLAELARKSSVSISTLHRIRSGVSLNPSLRTIKSLEKVLGIKELNEITSDEPYFIPLMEENHFTVDPITVELNNQNNQCPVCLDYFVDKNYKIHELNPYRMKDVLVDAYQSDIPEEKIIFICEKCHPVFSEVMEFSYPTILETIMAHGLFPIMVYSQDLNKEVAITNQSLLAEKLEVNQSTISRIMGKNKNKRESQTNRKKYVDVINYGLAKKAHVLCAKRMLHDEFKPDLEVNKSIALSLFKRDLETRYGYPYDRFIAEYSKNINFNQLIIKCDLMVLDAEGKNLAACFFVDTNEGDIFQDEYIGLGLCMGVKYISIIVLDQNPRSLTPISTIVYKIQNISNTLEIKRSAFPKCITEEYW